MLGREASPRAARRRGGRRRGFVRREASTGGPVNAVCTAIARGYGDVGGIATLTGLEPATVEMVLDHLRQTGRLSYEPLGGCEDTACSCCAIRGNCAGHAGNRRVPLELKLRAG